MRLKKTADFYTETKPPFVKTNQNRQFWETKSEFVTYEPRKHEKWFLL